MLVFRKTTVVCPQLSDAVLVTGNKLAVATRRVDHSIIFTAQCPMQQAIGNGVRRVVRA